MADDNYQVGYRRPPLASRFKPGVSGNPSGKRKAQPTLSQRLDKILAENVSVTEAGKPKRMTKEEVFLRQLVTRAIGGDRQFGRLVLEYLERRQASIPAGAASATDDFLMGELRSLLDAETTK
ncbi:DUF5681 domain-containing protein [Sphingomonas sp. ASV193]|uniref:DUF5681 domain-containing protein n=1 Tax=Sphingomonas sp. ASV193 TaxID=3144405 RepID=UPI0032E854A8